MRKFADFSRGWGIGEETFEFWSWLARQYVILSLVVIEYIADWSHQTSRVRRTSGARHTFDTEDPHLPALIVVGCIDRRISTSGHTAHRHGDGIPAVSWVESDSGIATSRVLLLYGRALHREASDEVFAGIGERRELLYQGLHGCMLISVATDTRDLPWLCE